MKDTLFSANLSFNSKGILWEFSTPVIMGIINTTPDSFFEGSRMQEVDQVILGAEKMIQEGAKILDIGGYSSRPGASEVSPEEEIQRTATVIRELKSAFPEILISIDTFRSDVGRQALINGADMINDISGGQQSPSLFNIAAEFSVPYILMHMRGTPQNMMNNCTYPNGLFNEITQFFSKQVTSAYQCGVKDIIIDPGFGFSKTIEQNYALLNTLDDFRKLGWKLLVGISRKSMIYKTLETTANESLNGTTALHAIALQKGAQILRVHDVKQAMECIRLNEKLLQNKS